MNKSNRITTLLGKKIQQLQHFNEKNERIPITVIKMGPCSVVYIKNQDKDGYCAIQLGFGKRLEKTINKPESGHFKKAGIGQAPRFLREVHINNDQLDVFKVGQVIKAGEVFGVGDIVNVTGTSKGKGFAGVVKRHHFKGGPRTHGQSDRERAPGSIGQTTTPGRVYKGKRMAGRLGGEKVTVRNLKVVEVDNENDRLIISGLTPGFKNSMLTVTKV